MTNSIEQILTIRSCISELNKVENVLKGFFKRNRISGSNFNKALLCLNEAVINSIEHGNKNDKSKKVCITITLINNKLCFFVQDEGEGFKYNEINDPTLKCNRTKESGRGIYIIKTVADNLVYNQCGNSVQVEILCQ